MKISDIKMPSEIGCKPKVGQQGDVVLIALECNDD